MRDPATNAAQPNKTAILNLGRKWCRPEALGCLKVGMLPADRFPAAGQYGGAQSAALVGRSPKPDLDPKRSHRLRLDRYDDQDFDDLRGAMVRDKLWLL